MYSQLFNPGSTVSVSHSYLSNITIIFNQHKNHVSLYNYHQLITDFISAKAVIINQLYHWLAFHVRSGKQGDITNSI